MSIMKKYFEAAVKLALRSHSSIDEVSASLCFDLAESQIRRDQLIADLKEFKTEKSKIDHSGNVLIEALKEIANFESSLDECNEPSAASKARVALAKYAAL